MLDIFDAMETDKGELEWTFLWEEYWASRVKFRADHLGEAFKTGFSLMYTQLRMRDGDIGKKKGY